MNDYSTLELTLRDILRVISPLEEDWAKRFQFINELRAVVESVESLRGATVEPYGSFVSNLFTRWGDLDISIELPNGVRAVAERHIEEICAENINKFRSDKSRKINRSSLSELFISFLKNSSLLKASILVVGAGGL